jgi:metallo-beta-lactamase class B/metallo-beta-lactamase class B GIM
MALRLLMLLFIASSNWTLANDASGELEISEIADGVYLHQSFKQTDDYGLVGSNGLVVIVKDSAYIIDTPWTNHDTEKLVTWIELKGATLKASLSTHSHEDRAGGIEFLNNKQITTYASLATNDLLNKDNRAQAVKTFAGAEFWMVDQHIQTFYPGAGHTTDNIVVWLPKSKLLFGGCFIRALKSKTLGYTGEASIKSWSGSVDNVITQFPDAQIVIPGHGLLGNTRLLLHTKKLAEQAKAKLDAK